MMISAWLSVVGIGEDGWDGLSAAARTLVAAAEILIGGERHLALVPPGPQERHAWRSPFSDNIARLTAWAGRRVCVLASGDPHWFGVATTLGRHFPPEAMTVVPQAGAFSLAAARLGWALEGTACLSIHGRPLDALALHLHPNARLLLLAEDGTSPARVAAYLVARGGGASAVTVFERLGGPHERRTQASAAAWDPEAVVDPLNVIAVEVHAEVGRLPALVPGLPDSAFENDGQLTKREVRALTLSSLAPWPGALLWDVGAGCGSIAIEWMRAGGRAVAVEPDLARRALIAGNAARLGVPGLVIVDGRAPDLLRSLTGAPDAVFLGGAVFVPGVLEAAWDRLPRGGRLAANAVTAEAEAALLAWQARKGGELVRLAVTRLAPMGRFQSWQPLRPVTHYLGVKP